MAGRNSLPPITESDGFSARTSSSIEDDTHQNQTDNGNNLDQGEPEFHLSVHLDTQEVGAADTDKTDGNPNTCRKGIRTSATTSERVPTIVNSCVPVIDNDGASDHFDWSGGVRVVPSSRQLHSPGSVIAQE